MLIVDDSKWSRTLAVSLARRSGHAVVDVGSGEEALECFGRDRFDVVLLDAWMPWMDGFETCRRMRRLPRGRDIPIAFMSGVDDAGAVQKAVAAGGDDILMKPLRHTEFDVRLRALLRTYDVLRTERAAAELAERERKQLEQLGAQKDALAEFLVHDLKSPLASVAFALSELLTQPLPEHCRRALGTCLSATESASRMVMNLLDLSATGRMSVRPAPCSVPALFGHLRDRFATRLYVRGVSVYMRTATAAIWADEDLLRRITENLIDNAIRYAPSGSSVELAVDECDGGAVLSVLDQGSGVPVIHRERIFDRFVQLDPEASCRAGRGLGLAFCRMAMEAHGGRIGVDGGPEGGARFSAFFPGPEGGSAC